MFEIFWPFDVCKNDLISLSLVVSMQENSEWPRLIWPTLYILILLFYVDTLISSVGGQLGHQ